MYIGGIKGRVRRMEDAAGLRPPIFVVVLANYTEGFPPLMNLGSGVDEEGHADISPWYSVVFLRGSQREWEEILAELRSEPEYQKPEWRTYDA